MIVVLLALQIVSSALPLSAAEAAAILRDGPGLSNRTNPPLPAAGDGPLVVVFGSATAGPFGEFAPFAPTEPLSHDPYLFASPWFYQTPVWAGNGTRSRGGLSRGPGSRDRAARPARLPSIPPSVPSAPARVRRR